MSDRHMVSARLARLWRPRGRGRPTRASGGAALRLARLVGRFHAASAILLVGGALLASWLAIRGVERLRDVASDASLAARQPALLQTLGRFAENPAESGESEAWDAALGAFDREEAALIDHAAQAGSRLEAMARLGDLYTGAGYALRGRLADLLVLARHARAATGESDRAGLVESLRREIDDQLAGRLIQAAELWRMAADEQSRALGADLRLIAGGAIAFAVAWLAVALLLQRRLGRGLGLLEWLAARDALTGALTHDAFAARLHPMLNSATEQAGVGLVVLDLDNFHALNATSGDAAGDAALRAVARRLRRSGGPSALVARLGSDTFGVAIPALEGGHAALAHLAHELSQSLGEPVPFAGQSLRVRATGGTALAPQDSAKRSELLRMAGVALREAKRERKGSVRAFHAIDPQAQARRAAVLQALDAGDMTGVEPWLQPLTRCDTGAVVRFEVLARWTHPTLGRVPPAEFLPIAEAVGRLPLLSAYVRDRAFLALAELHETMRARPGLLLRGAALPGLAINLAPSEIAMPGILTAMTAALEEAALPLDMLTIEVTEEMLIEGIDAAVQDGLSALRRRGVRLNLDNFGSGFANLSHLHRFEMDGLKIDRQFIDAIGRDGRAEAIIRGVLGLGHGLGIETVAEGIETAAQLAFMREAGCDVAQGYFIAQPMPVADIPAWMERSQAALSSAG